MIITRTPYRISLFGGGSDFPAWFEKNNGKVISFTINKYCYISARELPPFFEHNYRVSYSKVEVAKVLDDITHPAFRETIRKFGNGLKYEIHHHGDLPAKSGVGSSSAFVVGLINALSHLTGESKTKYEIAKEAIELEQKILNETVGTQDQIACSLGGINEIIFEPKNSWHINKLILNQKVIEKIEKSCILIYSGVQRNSSDISKELLKNLDTGFEFMQKNIELVDQCKLIIDTSDDIEEIGQLLHENWKLKKSLNPNSSNKNLDELYDYGIKSGAIGGKILGAGGGGFMLFWINPRRRTEFLNNFNKGVVIPFKIDFQGTSCVLNSDLGLI